MAAKNRDLSRQVYTRLREAILSSELLPGHKLSHQALAERLGVSHTPLREAFGKLSQEGYVRHVQNRGYFVSDFSRKEVEDLLEIREALEVHALRRNVEGLDGAALRALRNCQAAYRRAVTRGSDTDRLHHDRAFHLALAGISGNGALIETLERVFDRINLKRRIDGLSPDRGVEALAEHQALLAALEVRDLGRARSALKRHLRKNKKNVLEPMREGPSALRPVGRT